MILRRSPDLTDLSGDLRYDPLEVLPIGGLEDASLGLEASDQAQAFSGEFRIN
jgi:hypothetical protein